MLRSAYLLQVIENDLPFAYLFLFRRRRVRVWPYRSPDDENNSFYGVFASGTVISAMARAIFR